MDMGDRRQESLTAQVRSYYEAHIAEIQECLQEAVDEVFNVQPENPIIFIANALLRSRRETRRVYYYIVLGTTISTALPKRDIRRPRP